MRMQKATHICALPRLSFAKRFSIPSPLPVNLGYATGRRAHSYLDPNGVTANGLEDGNEDLLGERDRERGFQLNLLLRGVVPCGFNGGIVRREQLAIGCDQSKRRAVRLSADFDHMGHLFGGSVQALVGGIDGEQGKDAGDQSEDDEHGNRHIHIAFTGAISDKLLNGDAPPKDCRRDASIPPTRATAGFACRFANLANAESAACAAPSAGCCPCDWVVIPAAAAARFYRSGQHGHLDQLVADLVVLAEAAVQIASREKYSTCSVFIGNTWLLPFMQ